MGEPHKAVRRLDLAVLPEAIQQALLRPPEAESSDEEGPSLRPVKTAAKGLASAEAQQLHPSGSLLSLLPKPKATYDAPVSVPAAVRVPAPAAPAAAPAPVKSSALAFLSSYGDDEDDNEEDNNNEGEDDGEKAEESAVPQTEAPSLFTFSSRARQRQFLPQPPIAQPTHSQPTVYSEPSSASSTFTAAAAGTYEESHSAAWTEPEAAQPLSKKRQRELEHQLLHGSSSEQEALLSSLNVPVVELNRDSEQWDAASYVQGQQSQQAILAQYNLNGRGGVAFAAPSRSAKAKHHISSLVGQAAAVELDLAAKKASSSAARKETKAKYGW